MLLLHRLVLSFSVAILVHNALATNNIVVASNALRDGLMDVSRNYAEKSKSDEAKLIIIESYAREKKWNEVLNTLNNKNWVVPQTDQFIYYRALASAMVLEPAEALKVLNAVKFSDPTYAKKLSVIRVNTAIALKEFELAQKIVAEFALSEGDNESKLAAASVFEVVGEKQKALQLWSQAVVSTNATDDVLAKASWKLDDIKHLKIAYERISDKVLRHTTGLKLGVALLSEKSPEQQKIGEELIRKLVKDSPDLFGSKDAFVKLADYYFIHKSYKDASDAYAEAIQSWPVLARDFSICNAYASVNFKQNKLKVALDLYSRAEECASNDADRASVILNQGEILSTLGRGEESMEKYRIVLEKYPQTQAGIKLKNIVELKEMENKGRDLYRTFRFSEAQEIFSQIAQRDSSRKARMDYLEMLCLYGRGLDSDALLKAKNLASVCMDETIKAESTLWLAKFFYNNRQWSEAKELFIEYATKMSPKSEQAPSALLWAARAAYANKELDETINLITKLVNDYPSAQESYAGILVQAKALIDMSRYIDAITICQRLIQNQRVKQVDRIEGKLIMANALYVMGADNAERYSEALNYYRELTLSDGIDYKKKIILAEKMGRTLEKLNKTDEAITTYYGNVLVAYRQGRKKGNIYNDEVKAAFVRVAFHLSALYSSRNQYAQAKEVLRFVIKSDITSAIKSAEERLELLKKEEKKGSHL